MYKICVGFTVFELYVRKREERKKERKKEEKRGKTKSTFSCLLFSAFVWASRTLGAFSQ